jgi:hypothetical protein
MLIIYTKRKDVRNNEEEQGFEKPVLPLKNGFFLSVIIGITNPFIICFRITDMLRCASANPEERRERIVYSNKKATPFGVALVILNMYQITSCRPYLRA